MSAPRPRIRVMGPVMAGEPVTIRTLVSHIMESGMRRDADGVTVPRKILNRFTCMFDGELVFDCDLGPGMAANPYIEFTARLPRSGTLTFAWTDDDGSTITAQEAVTVG